MIVTDRKAVLLGLWRLYYNLIYISFLEWNIICVFNFVFYSILSSWWLCVTVLQALQYLFHMWDILLYTKIAIAGCSRMEALKTESSMQINTH